MKKYILLLLMLICIEQIYSQNRALDTYDLNGEKHGIWKSLDSLNRIFYIYYVHGEKQWSFYSASNIRYTGVKEYESIEEGISEPLKVIRLSLHGNNLKELPDEILDFKNLEVLSLAKNPRLNWYNTIEKLSNLDSLRTLYLGENKITEIPRNIGKLAELRTIWLNENEITDLPLELTALTKIEEIWLRGSKIPRVLPKEFRAINLKRKIINERLLYEDDFELVSKRYNYGNCNNLWRSIQNIDFFDFLEEKVDTNRRLDSYLVFNGDTINRVDEKGKMQGLWKVKYSNTRSWQVHFIDNLPEGKFFLYTYDGSIILEGQYKNGKKIGLWTGNNFAGQDTIFYEKNELEKGVTAFNLSDTSFQLGQVYYLEGLSRNCTKEFHNRDSIFKPIADFLIANKSLEIQIIGNSSIDFVEYIRYSTSCSLSASMLLRDYLIEKGIKPERVSYTTNKDFKFQYLIPRTSKERELDNRLELKITKI